MWVSLCTGRDGAALLSSRRQRAVLLCCVSESIGQFQVTFVLQCLLFQKQAAGKGSETAGSQAFSPSTNYMCTHGVHLAWSIGVKVGNHMDFAAISRGDRHVAGSWMRLLISCWSGKCSVPVLLLFPSTSTWLSWMFYYQVLAKKR